MNEALTYCFAELNIIVQFGLFYCNDDGIRSQTGQKETNVIKREAREGTAAADRILVIMWSCCNDTRPDSVVF